jgi:hypothetical protein
MSWNELSLKDKADYIKESVNNGIYNLSDIRNRYNMYANGGYKPSESIKKRITNWEGSSMRTNRSFQAEANDFNRVIPSNIRSKLSQQQLDALYSYGYNVGMGNLKKRVLPTLTNYVQGKASNEDVQKSMWASKDNELRGLTTRRNIERSLFGGKYQTVFTGTGGIPHNYGYTATTNRSSSNPYQIQNEEWQGKNYLGAYKGLQLSMNDIMGKTKETDIDDLFSTGTGPIISMNNLLSIGNNTVAPVQPDYSYAKSLLSDFDSDLNSNMFGNGGKIPRTYQGDLNHLKDVGYQKWRAHLPTNLREETSDYNLYEAYKSGAKPRLESDGFHHLPSRDSRTNKILKKATHPTYGMALREDAIEGYLPVYNNGETYTYPLPWIKAYGGKINMFAEGGNLNFIDADNRRSNILLHTEDGNLYDSIGNNYTQSYLDEEHIPIIKGTMPRNTRQYYDPNTTLEFINAAIAPISNFSPSNIVGSIREARDYNTFMNSFMNQDNTGFFTREYAKEHPYISTLGNIGGDILTGVALNKGYNTLKNNINSRINKRLFNEAMNNMANISDNRLDRIYNRLYNTGDYEDLQQLRDKHFEVKASNPLMNRDRPTQLYHTVGDEYDSSFNVFNPNIEGSNSAIYTTDNLAMSKSYSSKPTYNRVKKLYSNASKSYDIEGYYQPWNEIPYNGNIWSTRTLEKAVRNHPQYGIDRLVIHNIKDWGGKAMPKGTFLMDGNIKSSGTVIENFNPNDLKYSSAVTYDDLGNIIPLSKRDNFSIKDLRYSLIPLGTGVTLLNSKVK